MSVPIGYLVRSTHVLCNECATSDRAQCPPLYRENIGSYSQHCHECDRVLVTPATGWCELFTRDDCYTCVKRDELQQEIDYIDATMF